LQNFSYKKDVDDPRESPSFELMKRLITEGAIVTYNDPHISALPKMRRWPDMPMMNSQELTQDLLAEQYCVLVATDHTAYDWDYIAAHVQLIVDTRNAMASTKDRNAIIYKT
jgi:UDP-N-acetyl-D-glucosamine dehydrogenase